VKKTTIVKGIVGILAVAVMAGCAGYAKGPTDAELVQGVIDSWKAAMVAQDIEKIMAAYSEDFSNYEVPDKDGIREFLEGAIDMGYLEDAEIFLEDAETEIEGESATVYPIDFASAAGEVTMELTLTKEAGGWLITSMEIEGL